MNDGDVYYRMYLINNQFLEIRAESFFKILDDHENDDSKATFYQFYDIRGDEYYVKKNTIVFFERYVWNSRPF